MDQTRMQWQRELRAFLLLGRASNLPTVWSNCLAGWWLGGGGSVMTLFVVCIGAAFLYTGGMFLNDAFDAQFDREYRKERPIPAGMISATQVWLWGAAWLIAGAICLMPLGRTTAILTALLIFSILLYDAVHKLVAFSPVIMASCRFFLYLVAASTGALGVTGFSVWSAIALACYVVGLSYIARKESVQGALKYWPSYLMAVPVVLAVIANAGEYERRVLILSAIFVLWVLRCLRHSFWSPQRNVGRTVSGLLAGIVFVDLIAVAGATPLVGCVFIAFFLLALVFQKYVPAT